MSQVMHDTVDRLAQRVNAFVANNEELWEEGMKLSLLESKDFLESYEQPRYWLMYKPIKGNESQVEAVKVEVSNNSFTEFSQTLKRMLPCELEHNHAVKIQTYDEYQQLLKARLALETDIKTYEKEINDEAMRAILSQSLRKIEVEYFGLLYEWKFPGSEYRIVILARGEAFKDLNHFIYNEETKRGSLSMSEMKGALTSKSTDPQKLQHMAEIIKIHHLKRKNQATLQKIQQKFKESIDSSFIKSFKEHKQQLQRKKRQLSQNQMLINSFRQYEYKQSRSFIEKWRTTVKNAKFNLLVQVFAIYVNKANIPVSVKLKANGGDAKAYEYRRFDDDYLVYEVSKSNEEKFFRIDIDGSRFLRKINFEIEINLKNSKTVRYSADHAVYVLNKRQNLFTQELILQSQVLLSQGQITDDNTYCIIYLNEIFSRTQRIVSLRDYFQSKVFQNVGSVPSKYSESYQLDYSPATYKNIRTLLNNETYPSKLSQFTFQKTYLELLRFNQREENKSQRSIILTPTSKRNNKFAMQQRYQVYTQKLLQSIGYYSKEEDFQFYFRKYHEQATNSILIQKSIAIPKNIHKNFLEDIKLYNTKNTSFLKNEVTKFIYFSNKVPKLQSFPYQLRYNSHVIPIFEALFEMYMQSKQNDLGSNSIRRLEDYTNYLLTFIAFFAKLYPYAEYSNLKSDLYILRWLVQKKLPHFNDSLNRDHIGLQNFITPYLLHFFTGLPSQLTYRIWDLLISTEQRDQARILVAFTLLTFYEATDRLPIIPINQFMQRVKSNIRTISVDKEFAAKFAKVADTYFSAQKSKEERLLRHIRSEEVSIVQDRILKRIILGESKLKIPYEEEGKIPISRTKQFDKQNTLTIKELRYPLPEANYLGSTIIQIIIFLHDLHILENINLNTNKYWLKLSIENTEWKDYTQILQKDYFYNKSIRIPSEFINFFHITEKDKKASIQRHIKIDIVTNVDLASHDESRQKKELRGFIDYGLYHKDTAYKAIVNLDPQNLHNKGRTVLALTICLKSHLYDRAITTKQTFEPLETLSEKLLDYDIGQGNQCVTACTKLSSTLQKIKFPLDQFSSDQYKRITNRALYQYEPNWLQSSLTSIEQLKAIFYNLFSHEKDKSIRHEFYKFYQIFAEEHNMQFVYFAEMLVKFIMLSNISRKKKLMYLYCVAVHYQNCYSKRVNLETINSIVRLIFKQNSLINACPFMIGANGKIIEAYFFQSDLKSQLKKDFTDIVQDWAYICNFKFGYNDIILGSARDLSILRSFFDLKTLQKMEAQKQCRFQIIYEVQGFRYIWSATVDPKTFEIVKRGTKFLNQFTGYSNIKYLDSTQEYLLNCENVIPLHTHKSYSYQEFTKLMLSNHLIRYLLDLPSSSELTKRREEQIVSIEWEEQEELQAEAGSQYNSWAICRGQNCLESWHRCIVTKTGKIMSKVRFQFDRDHQYNVATLDLIPMDEIDISSENK